MNVFNSVLIIDDDPILRAISQSYFAALGTKFIFGAGNGNQALQVISEQSGAVEFILCDLNMPELDGVEFLRHLKECNYDGAIGIVSGEDLAVIETAQNLGESYGLNIIGTVKKPLDKAALDFLLQSAVRQRHEQPESPVLQVTSAKLATAIRSGQLIPHYQPKVDVYTGKVSSVEALARWLHPSAGLIGPELFIPCAERYGLIGALTESMIDQAIADAVRWKENGIKVRVALNVTPSTLEVRDLPDKLERQVADVDLDANQFTFEITERSTVQNSLLAMEVVARMRLKGFGISVDDFGTGTTNIEQLRDFPYSELKIDRSFVQCAEQDRFAMACIKASAVFAHALDMRLVAEGVSNHEEWDLVTKAGVHEVQGFLIAAPMSSAEFVTWYLAHDGAVPNIVLSAPSDRAADTSEADDAEEVPSIGDAIQAAAVSAEPEKDNLNEPAEISGREEAPDATGELDAPDIDGSSEDADASEPIVLGYEPINGEADHATNEPAPRGLSASAGGTDSTIDSSAVDSSTDDDSVGDDSSLISGDSNADSASPDNGGNNPGGMEFGGGFLGGTDNASAYFGTTASTRTDLGGIESANTYIGGTDNVSTDLRGTEGASTYIAETDSASTDLGSAEGASTDLGGTDSAGAGVGSASEEKPGAGTLPTPLDPGDIGIRGALGDTSPVFMTPEPHVADVSDAIAQAPADVTEPSPYRPTTSDVNQAIDTLSAQDTPVIVQEPESADTSVSDTETTLGGIPPMHRRGSFGMRGGATDVTPDVPAPAAEETNTADAGGPTEEVPADDAAPLSQMPDNSDISRAIGNAAPPTASKVPQEPDKADIRRSIDELLRRATG